jgi:hypothetical protein
MAVAAVAGVVIFRMHSAGQAQQQELAALRAEVKELEALRADAQELAQLRTQIARMDALKKDAEDIPRLRGEVSRLRAEQQQTVKVQAEVQRLQGALQQQQTQAEQLRAQQAQTSNPAAPAPANPQNPAGIQDAQDRAFHSACIANLKQLDGAKATWALENRKTGLEVPVDEDLFGPQLYIRVKPVCPAGGAYVLRSVETKPACTIAGHTL